jgi:hypothetical protein
MSDRALITKNYLGLVINCLEEEGYDFQDFEISSERVNSYTHGLPDPKLILYIFRVSSNIEKNYVVEEDSYFLSTLSEDLKSRTFDSPLIL